MTVRAQWSQLLLHNNPVTTDSWDFDNTVFMPADVCGNQFEGHITQAQRDTQKA